MDGDGQPEDLGRLTTEQASPEFSGIDELGSLELVRLLNAQDQTVALAVEGQAEQLVAAVDAITDGMRRGGRLVYVGAGTAGRLGVLDASECPPTFNTEPWQVVGLIAGGEVALTTAVEGAEDDRDLGAADVAALGVGPDDTVVGISASGRTPYTVAAVEQAARRGARTVGVACNTGSPLAAAAQIAIEVVVGPEVVSGSSRLKAGTAQKLVLNTLSTASMVRLGKTYGTLMVDVRATNAKLRARSRRIVAAATDATPQQVEAALAEHDERAKPAILALLTGWPRARVDAELAAAEGSLRRALAGHRPGAGA